MFVYKMKYMHIASIAIFLFLASDGSLNAQNIDRKCSVGGGGGAKFSDDIIPRNSRISEVNVQHGSFIDAVQIVYEMNTGRRGGRLAKHGGNGGRHETLELYDDEYIMGISGYHGEFIDSLTIHTNQGQSKKYGGRGGVHYFELFAPSGYEVVGFCGRAGGYVDAIGIISRPCNTRC